MNLHLSNSHRLRKVRLVSGNKAKRANNLSPANKGNTIGPHTKEVEEAISSHITNPVEEVCATASYQRIYAL